MATAAELNYNTNASAMQMAETIFGDGVTVVSASYTGDNRASAIYSGGDSLAPGVTPSDTGVILSTGYAASYTNSGGGGWWNNNSSNTNQSSNTSTNNSGVNNNADFNALAGTSTYDASWLDVDFVPEGNVMTISFVFASDEYPEYVNSQYLDMVGIWVNGEPVEMVIGDASVNNINPLANENLYLDNTGDAYNTEMDGVTVTLSVSFPVTAGVLNSLRIGIADVSDSSYDSNVLIAAGSV
ncbi:MAG: choice-of-anchor L domain-containing protein, partial [Paracoccaceae bacterium]